MYSEFFSETTPWSLERQKLTKKWHAESGVRGSAIKRKLLYGAAAFSIATFAAVNAHEQLTSQNQNEGILVVGAIAGAAALYEKDKQQKATKRLAATTIEITNYENQNRPGIIANDTSNIYQQLVVAEQDTAFFEQLDDTCSASFLDK